jgi:hypothetical protein
VAAFVRKYVGALLTLPSEAMGQDCDWRFRTIDRDGPGMFRVRYNELWIGYSGSIGGAREIVRCELPGRYDVDEIRADVLGSGITATPWGHLIRHCDGRVEDEAQAQPDR